LRNTRREYRDLGRNQAVVSAVSRLLKSKLPEVRADATAALALYGQSVDREVLAESIPGVAGRAMVFAVIGDTSGVDAAIRAYPPSVGRLCLLDALYYQGTPETVAFIAKVARDSSETEAATRAAWMLAHPMPVEAAKKF
jgi:hypothetical protein